VLDLPDEARQDPIWFRSAGADLGRDGCRVPLPCSGEAPPFGFGPGRTRTWLPQPAAWAGLTVAAQERDPGSTLALYRAALRLRHDHPALGHGSTEHLHWLDAPDGVLALRREPGLVCVVNFGPTAVRLPPGDLLLASGPVDGAGLPADTAAWLGAPGRP
jgi:alpha-glucosidase